MRGWRSGGCLVATRLRWYWASWGDSLEMIAQHHPRVAEMLVRELEGPSEEGHKGNSAIGEFGRF